MEVEKLLLKKHGLKNQLNGKNIFNMNIIIPIGGLGERFSEDGYLLPKPLIRSLGKPIIFWNIENLNVDTNDTVHIVYREEFKLYNFESLLTNRFRKIKFKFKSIKNDTRGAAETVLLAVYEMTEEELGQPTVVVDSDNFYDDDIISTCKNADNKNLIFYKKDYDKNPIYSYISVNGLNGVTSIKEKEKISDNACVGAYGFASGNVLKDIIKKCLIENKKQKNEYYISTLYAEMLKSGIAVSSFEINGFNCLGTPNQLKSFSSNLTTCDERYRFCFDLDNTLVTYPEIEGDYTSVKPIQRTINFLSYLYSQGHTIIIHTARRMKTHSGNVGRVQADIAKITFDTLDKFGIPYHEMYFGKPYAHFYVDDLAIKTFDDLEKETGFYNIHPETRSHNRMEIYDNYIIKYSDNIAGERYYYENIPNIPEIKDMFPNLIETTDKSIKIAKIKGMPLSFLNTNGTLSKDILLSVFTKIDFLHLHTGHVNNMYANYHDKVKERIESYDYSSYKDFEKTKNDILSFLKEYEEKNKGVVGMIHGDPVFTNILIDNRDNVKFIDMRGRIGDTLTIYGDIFYDWAKIYQSLIGYDHILMDKKIDKEAIKENVKIFDDYIIEKYGIERLNDIKNLTKSLLISLIPLHGNEKCEEYYNLIFDI
jgi:capsule biosynthesis phosphatase